jgi:hypothetical protein
LKDLREKSPKSASKVKNKILKTTSDLSNNPEIHSLDRFREIIMMVGLGLLNIITLE